MTWRIILRPWCWWRGHDRLPLDVFDLRCKRCRKQFYLSFYGIGDPRFVAAQAELNRMMSERVDRQNANLRAAGFYRFGKTHKAVEHDAIVDAIIQLDRADGMDRGNSCGKTRTELLYSMADPRVLTGMKPNRPPAEGGEDA